jgi:hypothetical protein
MTRFEDEEEYKKEIEVEAIVKEIIKLLSQHSNVQVGVISQDNFKGTLDEQLQYLYDINLFCRQIKSLIRTTLQKHRRFYDEI